MLTINDIANIVSDARTREIGGIEVALELFDLTVIPFLLNSAETWIGLPKKGEELLNEIHMYFMRRVLKVPISCPIPIMYHDLGQVLMKNQVMKKKLLFLFHISSLAEEEISKKFYRKQKEESLPGLVNECGKWLIEMNVTFTMMETMTKSQWKRTVNNFTKKKNKEELVHMSRRYSKISAEEIEKENGELKIYMKTLQYEDSLVMFRIRAKICPTIKTHWKNDPSYRQTLWSCSSKCPSLDQISHIMSCIRYTDLRSDLDLQRTDHIVTFVKQVTQRRLEEKESEEK